MDDLIKRKNSECSSCESSDKRFSITMKTDG